MNSRVLELKFAFDNVHVLLGVRLCVVLELLSCGGESLSKVLDLFKDGNSAEVLDVVEAGDKKSHNYH